MKTRLIVLAFGWLIFSNSSGALGQGMGIDSLLPRIGSELHNPALAEQLRKLVPDYDSEHVWGLAVGDFTNDTFPDLALSLYNRDSAKSQVHIYLFENVAGKRLAPIYDKVVSFVESPIEIGLTTEGSVVTITRKTGDQQWVQEGYSIESGDVTLVDRYETEKEDLQSGPSDTATTVGRPL